MFERTLELIGKDNFNKINNTHILIVGVGGVGSSSLISLVRSGVGEVTIVDKDSYNESNLNRQIGSDIDAVGLSKVEVLKSKMLKINPDVKINIINEFLSSDNINILEKYNFNYIIDACDTVNTKIELIKYAKLNNIKIISSMGMGNRIDPTKVILTKLGKTTNDPLAKKIRYELKTNNIDLNIDVVASTETPVKKEIISSMIMVPATAGMFMTYHIINDIIKE